MRLPSIKTLAFVFDDSKQARKILEMTRQQLIKTHAGKERVADCLHQPKTYDIRLHCLADSDPGIYGVEALVTEDGEYADYLNTGDSYNDTLIYWRGRYRVQTIADFIETMERRGVRFSHYR